MNLLTWLYFASILLTCALTGGLALYAWRQPVLPGVRTFARLAASECLLAAVDALAMVSRTQSQAAFWFNVRFVFIAIVPVLFLIFVLDYCGRNNWLSKPLLTGLFILPIITQFVLWTNHLHGLWVTQDVTFNRIGSLWLVDTSTRLPGVWFIVHSFYGGALTLAGIIVLMLHLWRVWRKMRRQALLLCVGALIAFGATSIPTFNLFPHSLFNPFIPGIGISALLYALAIFRFQFMKRHPAEDSQHGPGGMDDHATRSLASFIFIFVLLTVGIIAIGYGSFKSYEGKFRAQVDAQLSAIGRLKADQLQTWRTEREADAQVLVDTPSFAELVESFEQNPDDRQTQADLQAWLEAVRSSYHYERISLLDTHGVERVAVPAGLQPVSDLLAGQSAQALAQGQVTFMDFQRDRAGGDIYLSVLAPIFEPTDRSHALGVIVLRIDPQTYLYPFLQEWPATSNTAETLLVRREGEQAIFLNQLRFQSGAALNLTFPLSDSQLPAARAVLGQQGVVEGSDYRGVPVVADIRNVPGSPWFLESKMDRDEVYAPLITRLWQTVLMIGVLILAAGTGLLLIWRQQRMLYYRQQLETLAALRETSRQLEETQAIAGLGSYRLDFSAGRWISSPLLDEIFGIDETFDRTIESWASLISPPDRQKMIDYLSNEVIGRRQRFDKEYRIIKKSDGMERWVHGIGELQVDQDNQLTYMLGTIQDITERKQAEQKLAQVAAIVDSSEDAIIGKTLEAIITSWNSGAERLYGYPAIEVIGQSVSKLIPEDRPNELKDILKRIKRGQTVQHFESVRLRKDGTRLDVSITISPVKDRSGQIVGASSIARDISERKRAEQQLADYTENLAEIVDARTRELRETHEKLIRQERLATLGQLAGSVGHELRNPLGVISNAVYFLKMTQPDANATILEYLGIIENETRISDKIITDLLDFTRIKSVEREAMDVAGLVNQTLERYPVPNSIQVKLDLPADLPPVYADPRQIVQVLGNLVTNACQAMTEPNKRSTTQDEQKGVSNEPENLPENLPENSNESSSKHPTAAILTISARRQGDMITIAVQDNGAGISPENLGKLFEPLYTTKTRGIGLGLSVSQKLVEANGGHIEANSKLGQGSTFTIYIPIFRS